MTAAYTKYNILSIYLVYTKNDLKGPKESAAAIAC